MGLTVAKQLPSQHLYADLDEDGVFETNLSDFVREVKVKTGRGSALDAFGPREATLKLDNEGSEFSPRNLDSPYYPSIKRGKDIQVWSDLIVEQVNNLLDNPSVEVDDAGFGDITASHVRVDAGFFDGFDEDTSADWQVSGGTWVWDTANSRLTVTNGGANELTRKNFPAVQDGWVEVVMTSSPGGGGPMLRWQDASNYYFLKVVDDSGTPVVRLYKRVAAVDTAIGAADIPITFTNGKPHVFRLEIRGATLRAYVDGVLVATETDASISAAGGVGFRDGTGGGATTKFASIRAHDLGYQARFGKASVKYSVADGADRGAYLRLRNNDRPATPFGHSFVFVAWMRTAPGVGVKNFKARLGVFDAATGGNIKQYITGPTTAVSENWTPVFVAGNTTSPTGTHSTLYLRTATAQGAFEFFVDGCMLYETDLLYDADGLPAALPTTVEELEPYCDGDQAVCSWDGTAHESTSKRPAGPKTQNLMRNPSAETDTSYISTLGAAVTRVSIDPRYGTWHFRVLSSSFNFTFSQDTADAPVQGKTYVASIVIRSVSGPSGIGFRLSLMEVGGAEADASTISWIEVATPPSKYIRLWVAHTVQESDRTNLRLEVFGTALTTHEVFVDGWQLEQRDDGLPTPYCDGDQENCSWDGTAHGSTSQRSHLVKQFTGRIREFEASRWDAEVATTKMTATGVMESLTGRLVRVGPFTRKPATTILRRLLDFLTPGQLILDAANRYWGDAIEPDTGHAGCIASVIGLTPTSSSKSGPSPEMYAAIEGDNIKYSRFIGSSGLNGCGWKLDITGRTDETGGYRTAIWLSTDDPNADGLDVRFVLENQSGTERAGINVTLAEDVWAYAEIEGTFQPGDTTRWLMLYNNDIGWDSAPTETVYFWDGLTVAPAENTLALNYSGKWWDEDIEYLDGYFRSANAILEELAKSAAGWFYEDKSGNLVFEDITSRDPNVAPALRLSDSLDGEPFEKGSYKELVTSLFTEVKIGSYGDVSLLEGGRNQVWTLEPAPRTIAANAMVVYRAPYAGLEGDDVIGRDARVIVRTSAGGFERDPESGFYTPQLLNYGRSADIIIVAGASGVTIEELTIAAFTQNRNTSERSFLDESIPGDEDPKEERALSLETPAQGHRTTLMSNLARWAAEKYGKGPITYKTALVAHNLASMLDIIGRQVGTSTWLKHMIGSGAFHIDTLFFVERVELRQAAGDVPKLVMLLEEG